MLTIPFRQHDDLAQQTLVENKLLQALSDGMRAALVWQVHGEDCSRKLATMRFIARSFQRHLERLMKLEELDGYMDIVLELKPFLSSRVASLKHDHDAFRRNLAHLLHRLARVAAKDHHTLETICHDFVEFLDRLDSHHRREAKLFHEVFEQEEGGEG